MALKDLYTMAKADRYTADGREALIKAQETEDARRYQNGEISEKTGLMKTPNGWVEPPKGKGAAGGKRESKNGADWEKDIPNASTEELENVVKLEEKLPKMSEQSRKEFSSKIEKAKAELAKRNASKPAAEKSESHAEKRDRLAKQMFENIKEGDEVTAYGSKVKIVKKYPNSNSVDVEFKNSKGEAEVSHLSILDIDEDSIKDSAPRILTGDTRIRVRK